MKHVIVDITHTSHKKESFIIFTSWI